MSRTMAVAVMLAVLAAGGVHGGTFPSSITRRPLATGPVSDRLTVGADFLEIERGADVKRGPDEVLKARSASAYVGYDVLPWMTAFVTVGGVELASVPGLGTRSGLKVSAGVGAYLWESDVLVPAFMTGRFSVKGALEAGYYESDTDSGTVRWQEVMASLPLGYEKFDRYATGAQGVDTSLALYVGPAVSCWRGSAGLPAGKYDFEAKEILGAVAGLDVFFAPSVSLGAKILVFDEVSYGASLRIHF